MLVKVNFVPVKAVFFSQSVNQSISQPTYQQCDTRSQEAPSSTDPIQNQVQNMSDDALCICQSLSDLHQSAGSACQQFVTTSRCAVVQQRQVCRSENKELVCRTCFLCRRSICVELSTCRSPTRA